MKIRIKTEIPVIVGIRPNVGAIYEVVEVERPPHGGNIYFIEVGGERVGVFGRECEIIWENET